MRLFISVPTASEPDEFARARLEQKLGDMPRARLLQDADQHGWTLSELIDSVLLDPGPGGPLELDEFSSAQAVLLDA